MPPYSDDYSAGGNLGKITDVLGQKEATAFCRGGCSALVTYLATRAILEYADSPASLSARTR